MDGKVVEPMQERETYVFFNATVGWGWLGGLYSHFCVEPNYSVEVVLCCHWGCGNTLLEHSNIFLLFMS